MACCEVTFGGFCPHLPYAGGSGEAGLSQKIVWASSGKETETLDDFPPLATPSCHCRDTSAVATAFSDMAACSAQAAEPSWQQQWGTAEPKTFVAKVAFIIFKWLGKRAIREKQLPRVISPLAPLAFDSQFCTVAARLTQAATQKHLPRAAADVGTDLRALIQCRRAMKLSSVSPRYKFKLNLI